MKLGRTGLDVSRICLGMMTYGEPDRGKQAWSLPEDESRPLIKQAVELGINFFDTANVYSAGSSEDAIWMTATVRSDTAVLRPYRTVRFSSAATAISGWNWFGVVIEHHNFDRRILDARFERSDPVGLLGIDKHEPSDLRELDVLEFADIEVVYGEKITDGLLASSTSPKPGPVTGMFTPDWAYCFMKAMPMPPGRKK